jgi:hypothetical protein
MKSLLFLFISITSLASFSQKQIIVHDNHVVERTIRKFNSLSISGPFKVFFSQSTDYKLALSSSNKTIDDRVQTSVVDGVLTISLRGKSFWDIGSSDRYIKVYISAPALKHINASGASDFNVVGKMHAENLQLTLSGASDFRGSIEASSLHITQSGASDIKMDGDVHTITLKTSGASDFNSFSLVADDAILSASGASKIQVTIRKSIRATASGASDIEYRGNPEKVERSSSGASNISRH